MLHNVKCSIEEVPYCFSRSSIKFQGHAEQKIANFDPNWAFPDCDSSLNSPTDRFEMMHKAWCSRRGALLFFQVIHQISRSHGLINGWFESNLSKITRLVAAIKSLIFALLVFNFVEIISVDLC